MIMGAHYKIRAEKTGHYFTHGSLTGSTSYVWVCLHGYGQLAKYFIQRFEFLDPKKHFVIAPEGLNRFYFEGVNGRPVANWMTREDRLDEIADFVVFLNLLRDKTGWDKYPDTKVIYLGFSQGATSLLRWLRDEGPRVDYLLMWAGGLPDDISFEHRKPYFTNMSSHYFVGDKDPYFNPNILTESKPLFDAIGLTPKLHYFPGTHTVDESALKEWVAHYLD
jgi:predicted esterase